MAPMPLRFPLELNPHVVMSAIDALVKGRDWSTLRVSSVERELEARLLPERPPGWMRPRRRALLAAIERALASGLKAQPMKRPASHRPVASSAGRQNGKRLKKDADGDGTARPSLAATADAAVHPSSNPIGIQPAPAGRPDRWDSVASTQVQRAPVSLPDFGAMPLEARETLEPEPPPAPQPPQPPPLAWTAPVSL